MDIYLTLSAFIDLMATILGLLVGIILWIYPLKAYTPNKLLGSSLMAISMVLGIVFLIETRLILKVTYFYYTANFFALIFIPLSYLYLRSVIRQQPLHIRDVLHVLPALLLLICLVPHFLLSAEAKSAILQQDLENPGQILWTQQGWSFADHFYVPFHHATFIIYWLLQLSVLVEVDRQKYMNFKNENRTWINWIRIYLGLQVLYFLPYLSSLVWDMSAIFLINAQVPTALCLIISTLYLFFRPDILYGINGLNPSYSGGKSKKSGSQTHNPLYEYDEKTKMVKQSIETMIEGKELFLKHGYTLQDLSEEIQVPYHQLSAIINQETRMNFNDYLNQYSIEHSLELIKKGEWKHITLEALAYECGFNNRNSFTLSFKKFKGITPSAYIKQLK